MYSSSNAHFKKKESKESTGARDANDDAFDPFDLDFVASEDSIELTRDGEKVVTPVVSRSKAFTFQEDDYPSEEDTMFEPFHDRETNRIIMRMRMGSLMDEDGAEDEDSFILHNDKEGDEKPMWKLFEQSAFEKLKRASSFFQADKEEDPFDQVSFTDPYNAWDVLPSFLSTPYDMVSKKKRSPVSKKSPPRSNKVRQTTVIDKDGWPRASAARTTKQTKMAFLPNTFVSTSSTTTISTTDQPSSDESFEVPIDEQNEQIPDDEKEAELPVEEKTVDLSVDEKKEELALENENINEEQSPSSSSTSTSSATRKKRLKRMRDRFREKRATLNESFETLEEGNEEAAIVAAESARASTSQMGFVTEQGQHQSAGMGNLNKSNQLLDNGTILTQELTAKAQGGREEPGAEVDKGNPSTQHVEDSTGAVMSKIPDKVQVEPDLCKGGHSAERLEKSSHLTNFELNPETSQSEASIEPIEDSASQESQQVPDSQIEPKYEESESLHDASSSDFELNPEAAIEPIEELFSEESQKDPVYQTELDHKVRQTIPSEEAGVEQEKKSSMRELVEGSPECLTQDRYQDAVAALDQPSTDTSDHRKNFQPNQDFELESEIEDTSKNQSNIAPGAHAQKKENVLKSHKEPLEFSTERVEGNVNMQTKTQQLCDQMELNQNIGSKRNPELVPHVQVQDLLKKFERKEEHQTLSAMMSREIGDPEEEKKLEAEVCQTESKKEETADTGLGHDGNSAEVPKLDQIPCAANKLKTVEEPMTTSTVCDPESTQKQQSILEILEKYKALIQNEGKTLAEIKLLIQNDSQVSKREGEAFLLGLELSMGTTSHTPNQQKQHPELRTLTLKKSPSSSSEVGTTTSSSSFASPRMKARASSRSTTFNENVSNLMVSTLLSKQSPRARGDDDAKTTVSGMTTLSCRELSIQRLRRRMATSRVKEQKEVSQLLKDLEEAQGRQKRLEKQLNQAGITIAEDIPYAEAKAQVAKIADQMQAIGHSQASHPDPSIQAKLRQEYFVLEQQMEKYMRALELTDEYLKEQERLETAFDNDNAEENAIALQQVWKHMPVDIRQKSVDEWLKTRSPSGKYLPKEFLIKFSRTNILTLLRMNPDFILRAHPSNLEQRRVTGLTLTERRALHSFLKPIAQKWRNSKAALTKRKWNWYCILRQTFKDHLMSYQHHVAQHEQLEDGSCPCGGLKCPVKSNKKLDYFENDYGYPCSVLYPEYELTEAASSSKPKKPKTTKTTPDSSRKSFLSDIAAAAPKMRAQRKSSLLEEIAQRASERKLAK